MLPDVAVPTRSKEARSTNGLDGRDLAEASTPLMSDALNATVVELEPEKGWGKVQLEDGTRLVFDVSASRAGVPEVGVKVTVVLGWAQLARVASG